MAGDFVNQARPNTIPSTMAMSFRGYLIKIIDNNSDKMPKNDNRPSAKLMRSKKKANGVKTYIIGGMNDKKSLFEISNMVKYRQQIVPKPINTESSLPETKGS
jgi:hypothetical protein